MSKVKAIGQESLPIEAASRPPRAAFHAVPYLNQHEGLIRLEDLPEMDLDWSREVTVAGLMGEIGVALSSDAPRNEVSDKWLSAYGKDFENILPSVIKPSLYYTRAQARRLTDVLTVSWAEPTFTGPGVIGQDEGVAVTSTEFRTVSKNAELLAKHAAAHVGSSHETKVDAAESEEEIDDEDLKNRKGRGGAHAMEVRMRMLAGLDTTLQIEQIGLDVFQMMAAAGEDAPKLPLGEADIYRKLAMYPILQMVRVASMQLEYGTNERLGATRALISAMTRWRNPERRAAAIRVYAKLANEYTNAKRGKVAQAYSDCEIVYRKYKPFLKTKQPKMEIE